MVDAAINFTCHNSGDRIACKWFNPNQDGGPEGGGGPTEAYEFMKAKKTYFKLENFKKSYAYISTYWNLFNSSLFSKK